MKVLIASVFAAGREPTPPREVAALAAAVRDAGHDVDTLVLPVGADDARLQEEILALRLLEIGHASDRLITLRFPACVLRHPDHVAWCLTGPPAAPARVDVASAHGRTVEFAQAAAGRALQWVGRVYAATPRLAALLTDPPDVVPAVLSLPWDAADAPPGVAPAGHLYAEWPAARAGLLCDAVATLGAGTTLVCAPPPGARWREEAEREAEAHGVGHRVRFAADERERREALAGAVAAVAAVPGDATGRIADEAASLGVPCVALDDTAAADAIAPDATGLVVAADADALADALRGLVASPTRARALGGAARAGLAARTGTWHDVAEELLR